MTTKNSTETYPGERIDRAIRFAVDKHAGQMRKGTKVPYIVHPLEVCAILARMEATEELMIAGILHDTLEDTDTTFDEIKENFGETVALLVALHTEDKTLSWKERRQISIHMLENAPPAVKILVLADKVANLRDMWKDYQNIGEDLWKRFNASKEDISWYYSETMDKLEELQLYSFTHDTYWEFVNTYKDVFVGYYYDAENERLYQIGAHGESYTISKGDNKYTPFYGEVPENAMRIYRQNAERIEDNWDEENFANDPIRHSN